MSETGIDKKLGWNPGGAAGSHPPPVAPAHMTGSRVLPSTVRLRKTSEVPETCDAKAHDSVINKPNYITELYAVRHHWVTKILRQFDIDPACVRDCFATVQNRRFEKFYCEQDDALSLSWDFNEVHWCNPPWTFGLESRTRS